MTRQKAQLIEHILELEQKVYRTLRPIMSTEWLNIDLTMPQLKVVLLLFMEGPARISSLASSLGVSLATTTGITDRLAQHGLIVRSSDPDDRRAVICSLSEKGREEAVRFWELGQSQAKTLLEKMTVSNLEIIYRAMEVLLQTAATMELESIGEK